VLGDCKLRPRFEHGNWKATYQPKDGSPGLPASGTYLTVYARLSDGSVRMIRDTLKVLFTKSRRVRSRVATALRMCAQSLHHAKDYLGEFFRRITRKLGRPQAITATAHKLARIVFHLLSTKEAYTESVFHKSEEETLRRAQYRLRRQAAQLGFQIIPAENG
jgi:hypothetical protein